MISEYDSLVEKIERESGVMGAMVVGLEDGLVISAAEQLGETWEPAAALASSLFRRTRQASADAGLGDATFVRLEADRGHVCATARDDIVVVAVAKPETNIGKLRLAMLGAVEQI